MHRILVTFHSWWSTSEFFILGGVPVVEHWKLSHLEQHIGSTYRFPSFAICFRERCCRDIDSHSNHLQQSGSTEKSVDKKRGKSRQGKRGGQNSKKRKEIMQIHSTRKIYNLSSSVFSETELDLLRKVLNFSPKNSPNLFELFIDLNKYIRNLTIKRYFALKETIPSRSTLPFPRINKILALPMKIMYFQCWKVCYKNGHVKMLHVS